MRTKSAPKPRNPIARLLRSPAFRKQVARSARTYRRKKRGAARQDDAG